MKRRRRGTGSITPRGEGRWLLRWPDHGQRPGEIVHGSYEHAERVLDGILLRLSEPTNGRLSVAAYTERVIDGWEARGKSGARAARSRSRCHVAKAPFAHARLDEVSPGEVRRWLDALESSGLGATTVRHCAYLLSAVYRHALERDLVTRNPVAAVRKPSAGDTSRREKYLSAEQIDYLLTHDCGDDVMRTVALMIVGTSLRPGELLSVRLSEFDGAKLSVNRSGRRTSRTKTGRPRGVEVFGIGAFALSRWLRVLRPAIKVRGHRPQSEPWLVPIPAGWLRTDGRLGAVLEQIDADDLTAHDLRGTGATHLLSGTHGPPWTIAQVAAHIGDSIQTTERSYAALTTTATRTAAEGIRLGSVFRRAVESQGEKTEFVRQVTRVGHEGLEPSANGLREQRASLQSSAVEPDQIPSGSLLARTYLEAARKGDADTAHSAAVELARAAASLAEDSMVVLAGGSHWARAANRLAAHLLGLDVAIGEAAAGGDR